MSSASSSDDDLDDAIHEIDELVGSGLLGSVFEHRDHELVFNKLEALKLPTRTLPNPTAFTDIKFP